MGAVTELSLSPRRPIRLPTQAVEIPAPKTPPARPAGSPLLQLLPALFGMLGMGIIFSVGGPLGGN